MCKKTPISVYINFSEYLGETNIIKYKKTGKKQTKQNKESDVLYIKVIILEICCILLENPKLYTMLIKTVRHPITFEMFGLQMTALTGFFRTYIGKNGNLP